MWRCTSFPGSGEGSSFCHTHGTIKAIGDAEQCGVHGKLGCCLSVLQIVTEYLDWTDEDPGLGKFDVVIACDVLYEREAIEPVAIMAIKLLSNKGARFILADPESRTRAHR
jgi:predicted nicotinamide N-methyase